MIKSRFNAYMKAAKTLDEGYYAGYQAGLTRFQNGLATEPDDSIDEGRPQYMEGYHDGITGKPPRGFHHLIGNKNASGGEANSHMQIRVPASKKAAYVKAAQSQGMKLSEWVLALCDREIQSPD